MHAEKEQQRALFRFCRAVKASVVGSISSVEKAKQEYNNSRFFCDDDVVVCKVFRRRSSSYKRIRFDDDTRNNDRAEQQQEQQQTQFPKKNALSRNSFFNIIATTTIGFDEVVVEGKGKVLQRENEVFYNRPQVVNRDLSLAMIREFQKRRKEEHENDTDQKTRRGKGMYNKVPRESKIIAHLVSERERAHVRDERDDARTSGDDDEDGG